MKVQDLKGKEHQLDVRQSSFPMREEQFAKSKFQYGCGQLIKEKFPRDIILEEVSIPGEQLYLDFFIPNKRVAFELHGRQHSEYVPHFHKSQANFEKAKDRDLVKAEWCRINRIELYTTSSIEELKEILGL